MRVEERGRYEMCTGSPGRGRDKGDGKTRCLLVARARVRCASRGLTSLFYAPVYRGDERERVDGSLSRARDRAVTIAVLSRRFAGLFVRPDSRDVGILSQTARAGSQIQINK